MIDYLNEFTPDYLNEFTPRLAAWACGRVQQRHHSAAVRREGDGCSRRLSDLGYAVDGNGGPWCFRADGRTRGDFYLRNVAPPKRKPREHWVNVYPHGRSDPLDSRKLADEVAAPGRIECVRFREVIEAGEEKLPEGFNLVKAKTALHKPREVDDAFYWASTPQGCDFWAGYSVKRLSPEGMALAREALRRWIAIAERGVSK